MFFSTYVLTKKGPLAKVWLAAHWDKRLTRHEVKVVDLSQTILHIVRPVVPIALRTSGELLVGVVRIYALKVKHLLKEATEATLYLRVTTLATKGSKTGAAGQHRTTSIDGVVVPVKGSDVEAVTFDWNADVAAKHGAVADAAEALGEGRFNAIADLLGNSHRIEVSDTDREDALLASAWYTVQPASHAAGDELRTTQQDYDEIAKMRADLMAFGERTSGSASTSKSKSSLSSMEKGRGSVAVDVGGMAFPAVGDELDIGVPLPDELPPGFPSLDGQVPAGMMPTDPFLLPDMMNMDEEAAAAQRSRPGRKVRPVNVCDLDSTTLSREAFEKCMADRSDILNSEPRRGPYDTQEEADRYTVTGSANATNAAATNPAMDAAPLSSVLNPALRLAYVTALQRTAEEAAAMAAQAFRELTARRSEVSAGGRGALDADDAQVSAADMDGGIMLAPEEEVAQQRRKRGRDEADGVDDSKIASGVSASVQQTLERIRTEISLHSVRDSKRPRTQSVASLAGASCTLRDVCRGLRRRDAARTFVDVLVLASKQYVSAQQVPGTDGMQVTLNESALRLLAAA
ncbi:double-strand-break repair protein rad21 homolog, putative [Leishmania tarentolae]|uniref:Double-strand-break repair protein rad21 homolog, putative n=1 Tax=Leishmania tarentolae TaxID=5689 RepID=A0A640KA35_LEITA|nr:double-strand-break repair protein rad21 homolog, putative [Leishmania tarentolae]